MTLGLALTNDWELFGDGSGDYFQIQHKPLESLLHLCGDWGAKISVMAETGQQLAMLGAASIDPKSNEISSAWEEILKNTLRQNSDVQLHYHPQWLGAKLENGRWKLNMDKWALSSLDDTSLNSVIAESKTYLENLLISEKQDYKCTAFRAGAYCIQPEENVIKCLKKKRLRSRYIRYGRAFQRGFLRLPQRGVQYRTLAYFGKVRNRTRKTGRRIIGTADLFHNRSRLAGSEKIFPEFIL